MNKIFQEIVGVSEKLKAVFEIIHKVSRCKTTVLIHGESGTGKELVARAIHNLSSWNVGPFIAVHCSAIPDSLLESELFGFEKGTFTGAYKQQKGKFELANGGTLFLDEVGTINESIQITLLRVLQEGEFMRLGGSELIKADSRIISSTNIDLKEAVRNGSFRKDLYYRLNVVPIFLPPLRERKDEIPLLVNYFIRKYNHEHGRQIRSISKEALLALQNYYWPGNVRELENIIERAVVMTEREEISVEDISILDETRRSHYYIDNEDCLSIHEVTEETHRRLIKKALDITHQNRTLASEKLGITPRALRYKIRNLKIY